VSHYRLLELIPNSGARITDLAEIAGMTKQGLGQHVDYLQERGYTESERLPNDRRVRLVRRTGRGDEAVAFSQAAIARVEQEWRDQLGPDKYELVRSALIELGGPVGAGARLAPEESAGAVGRDADGDVVADEGGHRAGVEDFVEAEPER
jgi:DNA-binding MarR family transcriptional regulator